jgi:hypothetical protein
MSYLILHHAWVNEVKVNVVVGEEDVRREQGVPGVAKPQRSVPIGWQA